MKYVIKFIPVKNGTEIDLGDLGALSDMLGSESDRPYAQQSLPHKLLGFRPAPGRKIAGHIVVAVAVDVKQRARPRLLKEAAR